MKRKFFFAIALLFVSTACSVDSPEIDGSMSQTEPEFFNLTVMFDGNTYSVPCMFENDSITYLDENFKKIYYERINSQKNLAALAYKLDNGEYVVDYYKNQSELEQENGFSRYNQNEKPLSETRNGMSDPVSSSTIGRAILYDDKNFADREVVLDIDAKSQFLIPNLKVYAKFNDKTSSIRVFNFLKEETLYAPFDNGGVFKGEQLRTCLISYEDSGFNGKVIYCISKDSAPIGPPIALEAYHQDYDLKKIGWNDKISSVVFRIVPIVDIKNGIVVGHDPIK